MKLILIDTKSLDILLNWAQYQLKTDRRCDLDRLEPLLTLLNVLKGAYDIDDIVISSKDYERLSN